MFFYYLVCYNNGFPWLSNLEAEDDFRFRALLHYDRCSSCPGYALTLSQPGSYPGRPGVWAAQGEIGSATNGCSLVDSSLLGEPTSDSLAFHTSPTSIHSSALYTQSYHVTQMKIRFSVPSREQERPSTIQDISTVPIGMGFFSPFPGTSRVEWPFPWPLHRGQVLLSHIPNLQALL